MDETKKQTSWKQELIDWIESMMIALAVMIFLFIFVIGVVVVSGDSVFGCPFFFLLILC